jgi:hypothetical protein
MVPTKINILITKAGMATARPPPWEMPKVDALAFQPEG